MTRKPNSSKSGSGGPQFVRFFGPLLDALRTLGGSGTASEVVQQITIDQKISEAQQSELMDSGEPRFKNQIHWARFYLSKRDLIDSSKRGVWRLTENGRTTSLDPTQGLVLFQEIQERIKSPMIAQGPVTSSDSPSLQSELEAPAPDQSVFPQVDYRLAVLEKLRNLTPRGFEQFTSRILREAGFSEVKVTGKVGDGGIDGWGILSLNPLVSFKVIFQCKKYAGSVSSGAIRDFRGAMAGRADKGLVITTGTFTESARAEATRDGVPPIELIDADSLVEMLAKLELGLKPVTAYEVDEAFFREFSE